MDSIILGLSVVFPLVFMTLMGILFRQIGWLSDQGTHELNKIVFRALMPVQLFLNAKNSKLSEVWNLHGIYVLVLVLGSILFMVSAAFYICSKIHMDRKERAVVVQGVFRSNLALFGIPVCSAIYDGETPAIIALLVVVVVPVYNLLSVLILETALPDSKLSFKSALKIFKNPLVLGTFIGISCNLFRVSLPALIERTLVDISKTATPLAFIVLGGCLKASGMKKNARLLAAVSCLRLVAVPAVVLGIALALGFIGPTLAALLALTASPVAVSSFSMSKELHIAPELAGEQVVVTTLLSGFTMFVWIAVLDFHGLF